MMTSLITQNFSVALDRWGLYYEKLFGKRPYFSEIQIPEKPKGPMWLIPVAREIIKWTNDRPLQGVQSALNRHFRSWQQSHNGLDQAVTGNDRDPRNGSYAVWVRALVEADPEFANRSADELKHEGHTGITLLERKLLEWHQFCLTGEYLDRESVTLTTGSRYSGGSVPLAHWLDGFYVGACDSSRRGPNLRSRRVYT